MWKPNTEYEHTHAHRWALSLDVLRRRLKPRSHILEVGYRTGFTDRLEAEGFKVTNTDLMDCRMPWPLEDSSEPVILLMEVIEHLLPVTPTRMSDEFTPESGVLACLREAHRVLAPGGLLFLTTPNACGATVLGRLVAGETPMLYRPHVREMPADEVSGLAEDACLSVIGMRTEQCYDAAPDWAVRMLPLWRAGDTVFLLATK